jgi:hypothetical protein
MQGLTRQDTTLTVTIPTGSGGSPGMTTPSRRPLLPRFFPQNEDRPTLLQLVRANLRLLTG